MTSAASSSTGTLRVALFGSPAFALPTLEALHRHHRLQLVVAQPDRRAGRGMRLQAPATVERARELGIDVAQPARLKGNAAFAEQLSELALDVAVTAAYGKILPASLLEVPHHGFLNVHASLLPSYRGAAPVQWALIRGERETGVTIMQTDAGLDTGPIRLQQRLTIPHDADAPRLLDALAGLGARALLAALEALAEGVLPCVEQDESRASYAPMLSKDDGRIRWLDTAPEVEARHRGVAGWPGSHFLWQDERVGVPELRLAPASHADAAETTAQPGTVTAIDGSALRVACGRGAVLLERVKAPGKRAMTARDWANGRGVRPEVRLG